MRKIFQTKWTPKRVEQLTALYGTMSTQQVAAYMGLSKNAVIGKANRLGLCHPKEVTCDGLTGDDAIAELMAREEKIVLNWAELGFKSPFHAKQAQEKIVNQMGDQAR